MAADFNYPMLSQQYASVLQSIRDMFADQAKMFDGTGTNSVPTDAIRYSFSNKRFERFNGTAWVATPLQLTPAEAVASLGFTPYNATNPNNYVSLSAITQQVILNALGYTPYNATNPSNFLSSTTNTLAALNGNVSISNGSPRITMNPAGYASRSIANFQSSIGFANSSGNAIAYTDTANNNWVSAGDIVALSDERFKTNWQPLPGNFIARLAKVKHGTYDRTDMAKTQVGVGAQSLRRIMPQAVTKQNGKWTVAYGQAALTASVALAGEVVKLKAIIKSLEKRLAKLERAA